MTKQQMGRPILDPIDKMRRAALRQRGNIAELQAVFDVEGDNKAEIEAITGPGIRPKPRSMFLQIEKDKLEKMMTDIRVYESEKDLQHVPIDAVVDPLLENNTVRSVGRKQKDEFTILDRKLLLAQRDLTATLEVWVEYGCDYPPPVSETKKSGMRQGRKPKSFPERVLELKKEVLETCTKIAELESKLDNIQLMERQVVLLQNSKREPEKKRKLLEKQFGDSSPEHIAQENIVGLISTEIKQITTRINQFTKLLDNGWKPEQVERIKLANPSEAQLQVQLQKAEYKLGEKLDGKLARAIAFVDKDKATEVQKDLQRTEKYLEALKKKQALMREIERIEAEMKTI